MSLAIHQRLQRVAQLVAAVVYYGLPAVWGLKVEELIVGAVHELVKVRSPQVPGRGAEGAELRGCGHAWRPIPSMSGGEHD
jgi:hypothetical protein